MSDIRRPARTDQRNQVARQLQGYLLREDPPPNPEAVSVLQRVLVGPCDAWSAARDAWVAADAAVTHASDQVATADKGFDDAWMAFCDSIRNERGRQVSVSDMLDGRAPSEVIGLGPDREVTVAQAFLDRVAARTGFSSDATRRAELDAAVLALSEVTTAWTDACQARTNARSALAAVEPGFDLAVTSAARVLRGLVGESVLNEILPTFPRR